MGMISTPMPGAPSGPEKAGLEGSGEAYMKVGGGHASSDSVSSASGVPQDSNVSGGGPDIKELEKHAPAPTDPAAGNQMVTRIYSDTAMVAFYILLLQVYEITSKMERVDREREVELANNLVAAMAKETAETIMRKAELEREQFIKQAIVQGVVLAVSVVGSAISIGGAARGLGKVGTEAELLAMRKEAEFISSIGKAISDTASHAGQMGDSLVKASSVMDIARQEAIRATQEVYRQIIENVGRGHGDKVKQMDEFKALLLELYQKVSQAESVFHLGPK